MIKILNAASVGEYCIRLDFSDGTTGMWDASTLLQERSGTLLDPLRDAVYFRRFFIEAGALCWPNGLELSPGRLRKQCVLIDRAA